MGMNSKELRKKSFESIKSETSVIEAKMVEASERGELKKVS